MRSHHWMLLGFTAFAVGCGGVSSPEQEPPVAQHAARDLQVKVTVQKATIRRFEPIYLKMELVDPSKCVDCQFGRLEEGAMTLEITPAGEAPYLYRPPMKVCT